MRNLAYTEHLLVSRCQSESHKARPDPNKMAAGPTAAGQSNDHVNYAPLSEAHSDVRAAPHRGSPIYNAIALRAGTGSRVRAIALAK